MQNNKKKLSILVPVYNEKDSIELFFERINKVIKKIVSEYEISLYFLNNCSSDDSLEIIKNLKSDIFEIKYLTYSKNLGYQASLYGGLSNIKSDLFFIVDVDAEDPPEMLIDFLEKYKQGYKIVYGKRKDRHEFVLIKLLRKLYYRIVHFIADHEFVKDMAEFSLFDNQVKEIILKNNNNSPFIRTEIGFAGFERYGIEYKREKRIAGKSNYFITSPNFVIASIISTTSFPLRLIAYANILIFIYYILHYFFIPNLIFNSDLLLIILMLEFGILAVYNARIYKNQISRPIFIIDHKNSNINKNK